LHHGRDLQRAAPTQSFRAMNCQSTQVDVAIAQGSAMQQPVEPLAIAIISGLIVRLVLLMMTSVFPFSGTATIGPAETA
jgi:type II secretory pathway component PulF